MFGLAAKIIEILANASTRLLDHRVAGRDASVARVLVTIVTLLQELTVRGGRLLALAGAFADRTAGPASESAFDDALRQQVDTIATLRQSLESARPLLATIDADLYLQMAPFLDAKSGLLTRWEQQRRSSTFSTTTLFFLPTNSIDRIADEGQVNATVTGLATDRADFVMAVADTIREARSDEVRDIRRLDDLQAARLRTEIDGAQAQLDRAAAMCGHLMASIESSVGAQALASLRRDLVREASKS